MNGRLLVVLAGTVSMWLGSALLYAAHSDLSCADCHVPHKAGDPNDDGAFGVALWSKVHTADGLLTFELYSSPTLNARDLGQPDGSSKLCLGCHDGSYNGSQMAAETIFTPGDLAHIHPVSFTYDSMLASTDGTLKDPVTSTSGFGRTIDLDLLDERHKLQCTSCHDVHSTGIGQHQLRWNYDESDAVLCRVCHDR